MCSRISSEQKQKCCGTTIRVQPRNPSTPRDVLAENYNRFQQFSPVLVRLPGVLICVQCDNCIDTSFDSARCLHADGLQSHTSTA